MNYQFHYYYYYYYYYYSLFFCWMPNKICQTFSYVFLMFCIEMTKISTDFLNINRNIILAVNKTLENNLELYSSQNSIQSTDSAFKYLHSAFRCRMIQFVCIRGSKLVYHTTNLSTIQKKMEILNKIQFCQNAKKSQ